jgi:hypothetical protein
VKGLGLVFAAAAAALLGEAAHAQQIISVGNFSHVVTNLDKSLELYRDGFGLVVETPPGPFESNAAIQRLGDMAGAQSRRAELRIPGAKTGVELIEYRGIDQRPAPARVQDPGAAILQLDVTAVKQAVDRARMHGARPIKSDAVRFLPFAFLQDDDGFVVQLDRLQVEQATSLIYPIDPPAPAYKNPPMGGPEGWFEFTVADLNKTLEAYGALGLRASVQRSPLDRFFLQGQVTIGHSIVSFIQFVTADRNPLHTRPQDPGTSILQLNVRGLDALLPKLNAAGFTVVSTGGRPWEFNGDRLVLVRDPNNLFLELIEQQLVL